MPWAGQGGRGFRQCGNLGLHIAAAQHDVGEPQREAIDQHGPVRCDLGGQAVAQGEGCLHGAPPRVALGPVPRDAVGHLAVAVEPGGGAEHERAFRTLGQPLRIGAFARPGAPENEHVPCLNRWRAMKVVFVHPVLRTIVAL